MSNTQESKDTVVRFYNALAQGDIATLQKLGRPDYIQHNPFFETGIDGLIKMIRSRPVRPSDAPPIPPLEFVRIIAEGDYVMTLRRMPARGERASLPDSEVANVDIFRVQDGKVAEHWDYQEQFPRGNRPPKNSNGRF
jgi:predicted SnoaL-like aldol condensation-catalyzing enzyme